MSNAKGKAKKPQATEYVTTGKNAAVTMTFGIVFLALGLCWLLSMLAAGEGYIAQELSRSLNGLCGPVCVLFPILMCFCGICMLVSSRHRVNARVCVIPMVMYVLFLGIYTLTARYSAAYSYLEFMQDNRGYEGYGAFLHQAYTDGSKGAGGLIGMLIAYPLWQMMGSVLGTILIVCLMVALIFVLIRKSPAELIGKMTETGEQRTARREEKRQEKEVRRAAQEAEKQQQIQEQPRQKIAMTYPAQKREVLSEKEIYTASEEEIPTFTQQPVHQTVSQVEGFYPVSNELYDERFPLHQEQAVNTVYDVPERKKTQPVYEKKHYDTVKPVEKKVKAACSCREETPAEEENIPSVPDVPYDIQPDPEVKEELPWEEPASLTEEYRLEEELPWEEEITEEKKPIANKPLENTVPQKPVRKTWAQMQAEMPEEEKTDAPMEETKPSWKDMVQKKQREITMPEHTTRKGEAKQVFTDPVMPISSERIPIKPVPQPKEDARLDGTRSIKTSQTEMVMNIRYQPPPIRLLNESKIVSDVDTAREDRQRAEIIEGTLSSFGVDAQVKQIMHGPSITRFAIQIPPGVKVSKVTNTAENLALDLKTKHVRMEAPIQGTSYIGIEVPNQQASTVSLREVLDSEKMRNISSPLVVALGKDVAGAPIICDLSRMPHLLIAGSTGSGKSVCINSIVCSLLFRATPEQVRLIMIDPKQVELNKYNDMPHLLLPVISDPRKAAGALSWVVQEMQERYSKFSATGAKNLAGYNDMMQPENKLPNIVVIIDEMADLMDAAKKDVEESIRRLAALARAAGIYMVLATQRPSVDVITGVIKNNIPSRIAFAVSSGTDSRTIIDINGAEKLMGRGDMLYKPTGSSPTRVQGCFVSDDELNAVTEYIASRYVTSYDPNIMEHLEETEKEENKGADMIGGEERNHQSENASGVDELLMEAIEMALEDEQISTSLLQRRFRIGYARAGRLVDEMEKRGIVSQSEGSKPRKTLITREQYYQMFEE